MGERRRPLVVVGLVALALLAAGCARIPVTGAVGETGVDRLDRSSGVRALAPLPARGDGPARIVGDFLLAATGSDLAAARSYLTEARAAAWRPTTRTLVYANVALDLDVLQDGRAVPDGEDAVDPATDQVTVRTTLDLLAEVDASGRYSASEPGTTYDVELRLERDENRQWRIADVPDELLLSRFGFDRVVRRTPLYFPDPSGTHLVPDLRWFPERTSLPTTMVAELLAGPSPWLARSVRRAAPEGTSLSLQAVTVTDGVAQVDLSEEVLAASADDRRLLQAQLQATLLPLPGIAAVEVLVDGTTLSLTGSTPALRRDSPVDAAVVVLAGDAVARPAPDGPVAVEGVPTAEGLGPSHLGVGYEEGVFGVLTRDRSELRLLREGETEAGEPLVTGAGLVAPSFDRSGWVWTSPASSSGVLLVARTAGGRSAEVRAEWLAGREVLAVRVARDGARVVTVSRAPGDVAARVDVAGVVRDTSGRPTALEVRDGGLAPGLADVDDVTWVDESTVALLSGEPDGGARVAVVPVSGPVSRLDTVLPAAGVVTAARGVQTVHVGTDDGAVLARSGAAWTELAPPGSGRFPAFPG